MTEMITGICRYSLWSKRKNKRCLLNSPAWKTWMDGSTISWELFCLPSSERILCTIIIMSYKNEMGNYLNTKKDKRFILESWVLSLLIPYTDWTAVQQFIFIVPVLYIISSVRLYLWGKAFSIFCFHLFKYVYIMYVCIFKFFILISKSLNFQ